MNEADLRTWLLRRMREEELDPPVSTIHLEGPDDFVAVVHGQTSDPGFRARLAGAIESVLDAISERDLRGGPDALALKSLAELVDRRELRGSSAVLLKIAKRGILGGNDGIIEPRAEEAVLFALASLQQPKVLWSGWKALWLRDRVDLSPVAVTGLRIANPDRAVTMLPEIVKRALASADFPLGEVLWAFATDPNLEDDQIKEAFLRLKKPELQACKDGLRSVGATDDEIRRWLPATTPSVFPAWARRHQNLPAQPPRLAS